MGKVPHNWNWNYKGRHRYHLLSLFNNQMCIRLFYIEVIKNPYILWKGLLYIGQNVNRMWPCALTGNTKKCKFILNVPGPKIISKWSMHTEKNRWAKIRFCECWKCRFPQVCRFFRSSRVQWAYTSISQTQTLNRFQPCSCDLRVGRVVSGIFVKRKTGKNNFPHFDQPRFCFQWMKVYDRGCTVFQPRRE